MSTPRKTPWYKRDAVKFPLVFATVAGCVAGTIAMIGATGGTDNPLRVNIGLIAFGIAFIVSLLIAAMLQMVEKPNEPHLGKGSGINRRAADIPGGAGSVPDPRSPKSRESQDSGQQNPDDRGNS